MIYEKRWQHTHFFHWNKRKRKSFASLLHFNATVEGVEWLCLTVRPPPPFFFLKTMTLRCLLDKYFNTYVRKNSKYLPKKKPPHPSKSFSLKRYQRSRVKKGKNKKKFHPKELSLPIRLINLFWRLIRTFPMINFQGIQNLRFWLHYACKSPGIRPTFSSPHCSFSQEPYESTTRWWMHQDSQENTMEPCCISSGVTITEGKRKRQHFV